MAKTSREKIVELGRRMGPLICSMGGKAAAASMTAEERKARARHAINVRWERYRRNPPPPKLNQSEARVFSVMHRDGRARVEYNNEAKPTGRREYNAALSLVDRKLAKILSRGGSYVVIGPV